MKTNENIKLTSLFLKNSRKFPNSLNFIDSSKINKLDIHLGLSYFNVESFKKGKRHNASKGTTSLEVEVFIASCKYLTELRLTNIKTEKVPGLLQILSNKHKYLKVL